MKLDYDLIKEILEHVEQECDGFSEKYICGGERFDEEAYHYHLLTTDINLIKGEVTTTYHKKNKIAQEIKYSGLTAEGHRVLDAMRNDTNNWKKLKDGALGVGKSAIKKFIQIAVIGSLIS